MAQNSLQEMIDKIRASQKVNQMTPEQNALWQQLYGRTQPIAWQGAISWLSSSQKRKLRWSNAKDAAKWALSSIYGAAAFIPETLARIGTAWVDQIAGTDTQSKLDDIASYVPNKLRNSSSNTKAFDKWQEYTNDALMATALLTAWASWPKSPTAVKRSVAQKNLNQLMKNPSAYSAEEAANIIRARHSLPNTATENALQTIWKWLDNVAQRIWNTKLFKAIDKAQAKKAARELWVVDFNTSKVRPWTDILKWNDYPAFAQKRYADRHNTHPNNNWYTMSDYVWVTEKWKIPNDLDWYYYMWWNKSAPDIWKEMTQENIKAIETPQKPSTFNTSRARAEKLKNSNRSKAERTLLKKTKRDAAKAEEDIRNKTLEEMYDEWKRREDEIREAAEDAYNWKLRDEWRR